MDEDIEDTDNVPNKESFDRLESGNMPNEDKVLISGDNLECVARGKEVHLVDASGIEVDSEGDPLITGKVVFLLKLHRGIVYIVIASLLYALLGVLVQLATSVHVLEAGLVRGLFGVFFCLLAICLQKTKYTISKTEFLWINVFGVFGAISQNSLFLAYDMTTIGNTNAISYSVPATVGVLAWIFLKEPFGCVDVIITSVCVAGIFLISQPSFLFGPSTDGPEEDSQFFGALWASLCLLSLSFTAIICRKLRFGPSYVYILGLAHGVYAVVSSSVLNALIGEWNCPKGFVQVFYVISIGVVGFLALFFYNASFETETAFTVSVLFTSSIFMTYGLQFALFHVYPDIITVVGITLLLSSIFAVSVRNWKGSCSGVKECSRAST